MCPVVQQIIKGISKTNSKQEFCMEKCTWVAQALGTGYSERPHAEMSPFLQVLNWWELIETTHLQMAQPHLHSAFRRSLIHPSLVSLVILTGVGHKSDHSGDAMVLETLHDHEHITRIQREQACAVTTDSDMQLYPQFCWPKDQY